MADYLCTSCGYEGRRKAAIPGSRGMEVFLWAVLLIPGPFYSAWRIWGRKYSCPHCGKATMVRSNSEAAIVYRYEQDRELFQKDSDLQRF